MDGEMVKDGGGTGLLSRESYAEDSDGVKALNAFLSDISCIDELEGILGKPNIFDVLGTARTEIRHSNMLKWLLDPSGTHGLGGLFLRLFLQTLGKRGAEAIRLLAVDLESFVVMREHRHIDLLIVSKAAKVVIAVENKVDSGEHDNQLERYEKSVGGEYPDYYKVFVFLSPEGRSASDGNWLSLDYEAVLDAVRYCLKRSSLAPEAELLITQYASLLEREFMNRNKLMEICNRIYREHKQALDLIYEMREDSCKSTHDMIVSWFAKHPKCRLEHDADHSSKTYIRCTTAKLREIVPYLTDGKKSGWNSCSSAYYEIMNRPGGVAVKIAVSSVNLPRAVETNVVRSFGLSETSLPKGWMWKTVKKFSTKLKVSDDEDASPGQEDVDAFMAKLEKEVEGFEQTL